MSSSKCSRSRTPSIRGTLIQTVKAHTQLLVPYILISVLFAVLVILSIQIRSYFIDAVLTDQSSEHYIILFLLLNLFVIFLIRYGLPMMLNLLEVSISRRVSLSTEYEVARKKCAIPWSYYEDPEKNDHMELIKNASDQTWLYLKGLIDILTAIISAMGMFIILMRLGLFFAVFLFALFIPVAYFSVKAASSYYSTWERTAELRRCCDYQRDVMVDKKFVTERTLFEYTPFFLKRWEKDYQQVRTASIREELRGSRNMQIGGILFCVYIAVMIFVLIDRLVKKQITAGYAVAIISTFPILLNNLVITLSNEINQMVRARYTVKALIDFRTLDAEEGAFDLPAAHVDFSDIIFKQVSFQYPKSEKWVLKNINMRFEKGKHYAIVGENGAGKSTLIKLLLRLYQVTEGEILIDGKNVNDIPRAKLMGLIAALLQDHQRYCTDISENIGLGDIRHIHDMPRIVESTKKANFHERIKNMPNAYKTILGTMNEHGIELSGGEWQKLAISRLIMSQSPVKILDEPTASMDPVFEYELYQDFKTVMKNKTTISISHRLASCKSADLIYVIENGNLCEQGSHEALMANQQLYYKMYTAQRAMYL